MGLQIYYPSDTDFPGRFYGCYYHSLQMSTMFYLAGPNLKDRKEAASWCILVSHCSKPNLAPLYTLPSLYTVGSTDKVQGDEAS